METHAIATGQWDKINTATLDRLISIAERWERDGQTPCDSTTLRGITEELAARGFNRHYTPFSTYTVK